MARSTPRDRKSTRLNSSHLGISYAVFCLKKKNGPGRVHRRRRGDRDVWRSAGLAPWLATRAQRGHAVQASHRDLTFFFFNDTATPEISALSLPAALPI